jgi:pimeloyl-ACP methyl ester carboxylesterase
VDFDGLPRQGMLGILLDPKLDEATVAAVLPDSAAARAGVALNDRVVAVGEARIHQLAAVRAALSTLRAGDTVALTVLRMGKRRRLTVLADPRAPESEVAHAVSYRAIDAGGFRLRAIVHRPQGEGPWPAVLFLAGCDLGSVERPRANDPLRCVVRDLVDAGYAVVRMERRGVGDSEGPPLADATLSDERDDYRAALRWLAAEPWCAPGRVVLLGHSLGGLLAPQLCATPEGAAVRAMMLYGVGSLPWTEYLARHLRALGELQELDDADIESRLARHQQMHAHLLVAGQSVAAFFDAVPEARAHPERYGLDPAGRIEGRCVAYWQEVAASPTIEPLCAAARPTLIAWGAYDWQSYRDEHVALAESLHVAHPGLATFVEVPEADHNFSYWQSRDSAFVRRGGAVYEPAVGEALTAWLHTLG